MGKPFYIGGSAFFISGHRHYFSFVLISFSFVSFSISFSPRYTVSLSHSVSLSFLLSLFLWLSPSPRFSHTVFSFNFFLNCFLISILDNFQTLHMNWALPYKREHIYIEAHTPWAFGPLKGRKEILLKCNKFRPDSWIHPRNEHILIIPEILCSIPCG